jgi:hypothetical protein
MKTNLLNFALRIMLSIFTFIGITFFVAWLLEDSIYFSLFLRYPGGNYQFNHTLYFTTVAQTHLKITTSFTFKRLMDLNNPLRQWMISADKNL